MNESDSEQVDLAVRLAALSGALRRGMQVPAGRVLGFPELPDNDAWCDIAGAAAIAGVPPKTITGWLARRGPKADPFPRPDRILYRLYWSCDAVLAWRCRTRD